VYHVSPVSFVTTQLTQWLRQLNFIQVMKAVINIYSKVNGVAYPQVAYLQVALRTDENFRSQIYANHHNGITPFTAFPVEYMHLWTDMDKRQKRSSVVLCSNLQSK